MKNSSTPPCRRRYGCRVVSAWLPILGLTLVTLGSGWWFRTSLGADAATVAGYVAARSFSAGIFFLVAGLAGLLFGRSSGGWFVIGMTIWGAILIHHGWKRRAELLASRALEPIPR